MLDTMIYILLFMLVVIFPVSFVLYVAIWTPKENMKGHAGRGNCKCCIKN